MTIANRIVLAGDFIFEEYLADTGQSILPGQLLILDSNNKVKLHNVAGGRSELLFAIENAVTGPNVFENALGQNVTTAYSAGDLVFCVIGRSGDRVNARLLVGYVYTIGTQVISDGAGNLLPASAVSSSFVHDKQAIGVVCDASVDLTVSGAVSQLNPIRLI